MTTNGPAPRHVHDAATPEAARAAAERAARDAFGRIVASLAWRWRDLAAAQDALSDALVAALETWPRDGVPRSPEAWLTTAARRRLLEAARHRRVAEDPALRVLFEVEEAVASDDGLPDRRLGLLFACAHPDIDPAARTPLMLQAVLGLDAARIASAFLVSPAAMAQRLVRAKQRIREAGIPFELPGPDELAPRLGAVLEAVYAAFGCDWDVADPLDDAAGTLADEALFLARLVAGCLPEEPEAIGLLALLLSCHARRGARFDASGAFVPLARQDPALWDGASIVEADHLLARAAAMRRPGPFQVEAAIQSAHCQRRFTGQVPWQGIAQLHAVLDRLGPTVATAVGHAVALVEAGEPALARERLDSLPEAQVRTYQPYWIARWHLHRRLGEREPAARALATGIGLTSDPRVRAWLASQVEAGDG